MIEHDGGQVLLFADELVGEQQVVVKSLSKYIRKVDGVSGFALLGDGRISMILDPSGFMIA
jgi:two-component system chemotaxis sensor kinase CheA